LYKLSLGLLLFLASYGPTYTWETSDLLKEDAKVVCLIHTPSHHHSDINVGINMDGGLTFTPISINIPEKFGVVFECQHGKFTVYREELFDKLTLMQEVTISYKEIWRKQWTDNKVTEIRLIKYDFIDAIPREQK